MLQSALLYDDSTLTIQSVENSQAQRYAQSTK